jgi:hypothetical protein
MRVSVMGCRTWFNASISAFDSSRSSTISVSPFVAAHIRAVSPSYAKKKLEQVETEEK